MKIKQLLMGALMVQAATFICAQTTDSITSVRDTTAAYTDTIPYKFAYKWGFINKTAGHGNVIMKVSGDTIAATLNGHSIPWGGRVYGVNDTLVATVTKAEGNFVAEEKVLSENGVYTKPKVSVQPDGSIRVAQHPAWRNIYGKGTLNASPETMEAVTITSDMLALYRYGAVIDFSSLEPGKPVTINITGQNPGSVEITFVGPAPVNINGLQMAAWEIIFNYEYDGALSGYPVHAWLDTKTQIPLIISADIKIGHVEMIYDPQGAGQKL